MAANPALIALKFSANLKNADTFLTRLWVNAHSRGGDAELVRRAASRALQQMGDQVLDGRAATVPDELAEIFRANPGSDLGKEMAFAIDDIAVRRLWARHRVVYSVDRTLWDELGETADSDVIHPDVFKSLPHPDPFIAFPTPLILDAGGAELIHVGGVQVIGRRDLRKDWGPQTPLGNFEQDIRCSTHSEDCVGIALMFYGPMHRRDGSPITIAVGGQKMHDATLTRTTLDFPDGKATTFAELIANLKSRFDMPYFDPAFGGDPYASMEAMVRRALSSLAYICAENADMEKAPPMVARESVRQASGAGAAPKPPRVVNVGYRVGAALRTHRERLDSGWYGHSGRTMPPHIRRSHFHTFKVGKGRTQSKVKWLGPIPVNVDLDDGSTIQVVPVKGG